jgi:hypothetical protein
MREYLWNRPQCPTKQITVHKSRACLNRDANNRIGKCHLRRTLTTTPAIRSGWIRSAHLNLVCMRESLPQDFSRYIASKGRGLQDPKGQKGKHSGHRGLLSIRRLSITLDQAPRFSTNSMRRLPDFSFSVCQETSPSSWLRMIAQEY